MDFIAIDFETGKYDMSSAISVGLVKYIDNQKVDSFYSLICPPELYIRPDFTRIHGLTVDDVKDAPTFDIIWKKNINSFLEGLPLVAHNARFDMGVLSATLDRYKIPVPRVTYFDSLQIARQTWPDLESHALTFLGETFNITYDAHNALADAETCAKIVLLAEKEVTRKGHQFSCSLRLLDI